MAGRNASIGEWRLKHYYRKERRAVAQKLDFHSLDATRPTFSRLKPIQYKTISGLSRQCNDTATDWQYLFD